jgi:hypothetical protein
MVPNIRKEKNTAVNGSTFSKIDTVVIDNFPIEYTYPNSPITTHITADARVIKMHVGVSFIKGCPVKKV